MSTHGISLGHLVNIFKCFLLIEAFWTMKKCWGQTAHVISLRCLLYVFADKLLVRPFRLTASSPVVGVLVHEELKSNSNARWQFEKSMVKP
ncbi:hypothetical protein XELAEV_18047127mg [Xenopus laevis]|uniref:Uncharacterized protein n=1 Tax=Xenopus laevis TaxID=8355 RepID=A0A974H181_XENLA|nr:hypothetical protein XELAEV_18047127mg [Xenopus laevis]